MRTVPDLRLAPALADQASVVLPLVVVAQPAEDGTRVAGAFPRPAAELVGGREKQHDQRLLVIGLRGKDVEADALRLLRLVEQPVSLCLGERAWNGLAGDRLELPHDASRSGPRTEDAKELSERIVHLVDHPFFQRDDRVVGDVDLFRTDPGAALGDVAVTDALQLLE